MANAQDVAKAFARFEAVGLQMPTSLVYSAAEQRAVLIEEWVDLFKFTESSLFMASVPLVLKNCRFWPKPFDMAEAVEEIKRSTLAAKKREEPKQPSSRELDPSVKKLIADVLQNHSFAQSMPIEKDVTDEARSYFPGISDELIRKNYPEFRMLTEQRDRLFNDPSARGYRLKPRLNPNGAVILDTIFVS